MRTHESVLKHNYEVKETVETGKDWQARKYFIGDQEVMDKRVIIRFKENYVHIQSIYNALGSFHEYRSIELTREQFDFIKDNWK